VEILTDRSGELAFAGFCCMIKTIATFPYARDPMHRIVGDAKKGWACALGLMLVRIDPSGEVRSEFLQSDLQPRDSGFQGIADGQFILGTSMLAGHYISIGHFKNGEQVSEADFGDRYSTFSSYTQLDGGLAGVCLVNPQRWPVPLPFSVFDAFYRPDGGEWWCDRFQYPSQFTNGSTPIFSRNITCCRGPANTLYAFTEMDSSAKIGLQIFAPVGNALRPLGPFKESWLNSQSGPLAPGGEWPQVTAVWDALNDRVLIAFLHFEDRLVNDPTYPIPGKERYYSRWVVAEVRGEQANCLGHSPWYGSHDIAQQCVIVPMNGGGLYFGGHFQDIDGDFAQGFKFAWIDSAGKWTMAADTLPYGMIASHSDDGLIVFAHAGTADKHILQISP